MHGLLQEFCWVQQLLYGFVYGICGGVFGTTTPNGLIITATRNGRIDLTMPTKLRIAVTHNNATYLGSSALKVLLALYGPKPDGFSWKKWLSKLKREMLHRDNFTPSKCAVFLFQEVRRCPKSKSEYRSRFIRKFRLASQTRTRIGEVIDAVEFQLPLQAQARLNPLQQSRQRD